MRRATDASAEFQAIFSDRTWSGDDTTVVLSCLPTNTGVRLSTKQVGDEDMKRTMAQSLTYGKHGFFDRKLGLDEAVDEDSLRLFQSNGGRQPQSLVIATCGGLLVSAKVLRHERKSHLDMGNLFLVDQEDVRDILTRLAAFSADTYQTVYGYAGTVYVTAGLLNMGHRMFGPRPSGEQHTGHMFPGDGSTPVIVPGSPEQRDMPASPADWAAVAEDMVELFRRRFRNERRPEE